MSNQTNAALPQAQTLQRQLSVFDATMMGLGSILGTGVFVSIAIAAEAAGPAVLLAIAAAGVVAACNGLSSAQLAANHPVSGGTYEYGYRWLTPQLGFLAGWLFLFAKSASAATAALGFASYARVLVGFAPAAIVPLAAAAVVVLTLLVLAGIRRTSLVNIAIVSVTILTLVAFVLARLPATWRAGNENMQPFFAPLSSDVSPLSGFLEACALMFVAYTGYGRIATLGEEVQNPRRNIPLAIIATLVVSMALYAAVGGVAVASTGVEALQASGETQAAPLAVAAQATWLRTLVSVGAVTAMLGVLLNLILGLSRVLLAMARRGDMPRPLARLSVTGSTPTFSVVAVGALIAGLTLIGSVKLTWSFSAFTVLVYYALTNLAALQLSEAERRYPQAVSWAGLLSCLFLAFWVDAKVWMIGLGVIGLGFVWRAVAKRLGNRVV